MVTLCTVVIVCVWYEVASESGNKRLLLLLLLLLGLQEAFAERVKLYRAWKDDEANVAKKRELKSRLELTHKTDKLNETNREISEVGIFAVVFVTFLQVVAFGAFAAPAKFAPYKCR